MEHGDLLYVAHRSLALGEFPWLRYQRNGAREVREGVAFVRQDMPGPGANFAAALGEAPPLARIVELAGPFFNGCDGGYGVLVEGDAGHPVEAELRAAGWSVAEDEPALVLPHIPAGCPSVPDLLVRLIGDEARMRDSLAILAEAIEVPPEVLAEWAPAPASLADPDSAMLVGYCDGRPAATAMMYRVEGTAVIAGVATVPDCRRRGFGTAITAAAVAEGAARGCTAASLRSGPMSFDLYVKMGFIPVCRHRTYHEGSGFGVQGSDGGSGFGVQGSG
jgi:GNAT superfamily N-acetyltransferase